MNVSVFREIWSVERNEREFMRTVSRAACPTEITEVLLWHAHACLPEDEVTIGHSADQTGETSTYFLTCPSHEWMHAEKVSYENYGMMIMRCIFILWEMDGFTWGYISICVDRLLSVRFVKDESIWFTGLLTLLSWAISKITINTSETQSFTAGLIYLSTIFH